jgi:quinol monooxygenase YgiN
MRFKPNREPAAGGTPAPPTFDTTGALTMLHVIATITVKPGLRAEFLKHFAWVTPLVRAEDGCIEYGAGVDLETGISVQMPLRPDVVVVVEKWESVAHLRTHLAAPHMAEYRVKVREVVTNVTLQMLEPTA